MSGLDSLYKLPLDFIDRDKLLDLLERCYEAGFKDAGGEVPPEVFHAENRTKTYDKFLNKKYDSIAQAMKGEK